MLLLFHFPHHCWKRHLGKLHCLCLQSWTINIRMYSCKVNIIVSMILWSSEGNLNVSIPHQHLPCLLSELSSKLILTLHMWKDSFCTGSGHDKWNYWNRNSIMNLVQHTQSMTGVVTKLLWFMVSNQMQGASWRIDAWEYKHEGGFEGIRCWIFWGDWRSEVWA